MAGKGRIENFRNDATRSAGRREGERDSSGDGEVLKHKAEWSPIASLTGSVCLSSPDSKARCTYGRAEWANTCFRASHSPASKPMAISRKDPGSGVGAVRISSTKLFAPESQVHV